MIFTIFAMTRTWLYFTLRFQHGSHLQICIRCIWQVLLMSHANFRRRTPRRSLATPVCVIFIADPADAFTKIHNPYDNGFFSWSEMKTARFPRLRFPPLDDSKLTEFYHLISYHWKARKGYRQRRGNEMSRIEITQRYDRSIVYAISRCVSVRRSVGRMVGRSDGRSDGWSVGP